MSNLRIIAQGRIETGLCDNVASSHPRHIPTLRSDNHVTMGKWIEPLRDTEMHRRTKMPEAYGPLTLLKPRHHSAPLLPRPHRHPWQQAESSTSCHHNLVPASLLCKAADA